MSNSTGFMVSLTLILLVTSVLLAADHPVYALIASAAAIVICLWEIKIVISDLRDFLGRRKW